MDEFGKPAFYAMIGSAAKADLFQEFQADTGQQKKHLAALNENRQNELKGEIKQVLSTAMQVDKRLEEQSNGLDAISNLHFEHAIVNQNLAKAYMNEKYSEWQLLHDQKSKKLEHAVGNMNGLNFEDIVPDENRKILNHLSVGAESKYMLMSGMRETIDMLESELVGFRQEVGVLDQEYSLLDPILESQT